MDGVNSKNWRAFEWPVIGLLWVLALVLGYIGFLYHAIMHGEGRSALDLIYLDLQLITMNSGAVATPTPWQLEVARFLLPFMAAWTAVRALLGLFRERWQLFRMRRWRDHIVICGLSRKGWLLVRSFRERGERVVVIERDGSSELIVPSRGRGAPVLVGDATDPDLLRRAGVTRAQRVIAVTDDDGANAEVAVRVQALLREESQQADRPRAFLAKGAAVRPSTGSGRTTPVTCTVHIVDPQLWELARARELAMEEGLPLRLELFNVFDSAARLLWSQYVPAPGVQPGPLHVLIVGLGRLGESLVVHAARSWYMAGQAGLHITVIDQDASWKCRALAMRYPRLERACRLGALDMNVRWPEFIEGAYLLGGDDQAPVAAVFVCFDDDSLGLRTGLALHHRLRQLRQKGAPPAPITVRMAEAGGLARLLEPGGNGRGAFAGLHAFDLLDRTCTPDPILLGTHEILARANHEDYLRRELAGGATPGDNSSAVPWEALPDDVRRSNLSWADGILQHLNALGYDLAPLTDWDAARLRLADDEVEQMAQLEHDRFVAERLAMGWQYHPTRKDARLKLSPALRPWAELPEADRARTRAQVRELPAFLARTGFEMVRTGYSPLAKSILSTHSG